MNFSSQDAAQTLLSLGSGRGSVLGLGLVTSLNADLGLALGTSETADLVSVQDSTLDWVSDSNPTVFINANDVLPCFISIIRSSSFVSRPKQFVYKQRPTYWQRFIGTYGKALLRTKFSYI